MIRRSLRIGIRLGMLGGLAFALFKIAQARRPLPAVPKGDDPLAPTWAPSPEPASTPEPGSDEPALVDPTMLRSTSLKRSTTRPDDHVFDAASTAPPVVSATTPFGAGGLTAPGPVPDPAPEIEPDDDEIVILSTGDDMATPAAGSPAVESGSATSPESTAGAPAKASVSPKKSPPPKKATTKKAASAKKSPTKKTTKKATAKKAVANVAWVDPQNGVCPTTYPVKAKLRSAIFHLPGMAAYARTSPDRCYRDEAAATDDGLRKAAR